ncbi:hypothetical protein [Novosphingobium malaysiense]|uniref:Uncharacterized protein n=1 Tax=Novosphingobium malaysiense TaxID=1348853 RepID=A0A0B1ZP07_9SPHN|nr:hypothetical protein [Novosphingobium malaysiense]KHK92885.1 hypothetical protein LK12_00285 [Novosphingobium malaysiense]
MPQRQSRHPDNELIDSMAEAPSQQSSSGGNVARDVGKRAEEQSLKQGEGVERVTGRDHPAEDARKGGKSLSQMQGGG